jgi:tRNA(Ile2)-agmatinylcytidine synthase
VHLGLDDTDSREGGCTTYVAALIVERLVQAGATFVDYPNLVRLNPNVPWKTRGNGAVALRFDYRVPARAFQLAHEVLRASAHADGSGAHPAVSMLEGEIVPQALRAFSEECLHRVVSPALGRALAQQLGLRASTRGHGLGLVGALAAIGAPLESDYTYELLAYRSRQRCGTPRAIDPGSVHVLPRRFGTEVFNCIDPETQRVLITPHGPDPVLFGIRGESAEVVIEAARALKLGERPERCMVVRSNQGTGVHLEGALPLSPPKAYSAGRVRGEVRGRPATSRGGHVFLSVRHAAGTLRCAAYEPTGGFRAHILALRDGDRVEFGGGLRRRSLHHEAVLNVEYLRLLQLGSESIVRNPTCPSCGRRMSSAGRSQGFRCARCRQWGPAREVMAQERDIILGLYLPPPRAHRHLTKPLHRYGREKRGRLSALLRVWHGRGLLAAPG